MQAGGQTSLIESLKNPALYGSWCHRVSVIETHISFVILTGRYALKIKKAVSLGFLDFTTLAARHFYCHRELDLNKRVAPAIYLDVVPITGTAAEPRIGGDGPAIEYAVRMREFPQDALLTRVLARGELRASDVDDLAATVATFHASAAVATVAHESWRFASADSILDLAVRNFIEIEPSLELESDRLQLARLRRWTEREHAERNRWFTERQRRGFVRECHGDLHLGNIALTEGGVTIFDCIEFNDQMRWTDVMADVAFLTMDLQEHRRPDFAVRFLNRYLELTGDYDGMAVLRFYVVYRAMVRAKVACLRASQTADGDARHTCINDYRKYIGFAERASQATRAAVVITHGPAGSGKTTLSEGLVELAGAIRIRTDVERKRRHGLGSQFRSGSGLNAGMYSAEETNRTYASVARLARTISAAGYPVVVDGTFLQRRHRDRFLALAADLGVPFVIVDFVARAETLRDRVRRREKKVADTSEADVRVLEDQLDRQEPLTRDEQALSVACDAEMPLERSRQMAAWQEVLDRLHVMAAVDR
jgi:aminoglycoside phosphotransferase family enzyme/predicted kinase